MGRRVMAIVAALLVALLGATGVVRLRPERRRAGGGGAGHPAGVHRPGAGASGDVGARRVGAEADRGADRGQPGCPGRRPDRGRAAPSRPWSPTTAIARGEIVLASRFGQLAKQPAPTGPVPDGQVAITVNLPDPERIAPLLTPGSHIVIYDTFNPRNGAGSAPLPDGGKLVTGPPGVRATRVLFDDVNVLAVGAAVAKPATALVPTGTPTPTPSADAAAQSGALVTVALPPAEALRLVHAVQTGTLYCGLRGAKLTLDHNAFVNDTTVVGK